MPLGPPERFLGSSSHRDCDRISALMPMRPERGAHAMSLQPHAIYPIPEDTQRVARAAFPHGNIYMQVADRLGPLYHDEQFTVLFPRRGQPAEAPARLALVTLLQFAEGLSDRQAADAVRSRIDWKYVLGSPSPILASTIPS